jgi:hypothetical protein
MLQLLARTAAGLVILIGGLILQAVGMSVGVWIALGGLLLMFVVNLIAPWPSNMGWRRMRE